MIRQKYLTETQAAVATGMSVSTLLRFAEAGYLLVQDERDGQRLFAPQQLQEVFGTLAEPPYGEETESEMPASAEEPQAEIVDLKTTAPVEDIADDSLTSTVNSQLSEQIEKIIVADDGTESLVPTPQAVEEPAEKLAVAPQLEAAQPTATEDTPSTQENGSAVEHGSAVTNGSARELGAKTAEIDRLKRVVELQDQLLESREAIIADLQTQCAWLKERVERLEDKADRDQLLILSETQALTRMLEHQMEPRSAIGSFLEWTGLKKSRKPALTEATTIEVQEASKKSRKRRRK